MENITIDDDAGFIPIPIQIFKPSEYQVAIFDWIRDGSGDAIVNAVAGSGKTTLLEGCAQRVPPGASAVYCAFNKDIVTVSRKRFEPVECKTISSMGLATLTRYFDKQPTVDSNKYSKLVRREAWKLADRLPTVSRGDLVSSLSDLVDYSQATLFKGSGNDVQILSALVSHFGLVLPCALPDLAPSVDSVLRAGIQQAGEEHVISFSDMLWLPWVWELQPRRYDWVFVDECQDLNAAQLDLVLKMRRGVREEVESGRWTPKGRMIFVGDPRQAIYGFSGADAESYANIKARTRATEFPLSVSYRCPVLVIREAQAIVPGILPRPNAPLGTVRWISETALFSEVKEGDLLLCRMTAPLISTCLDLIRQRVPARVRGKDIGRLLTKTVAVVAERSGFTFSDFPKFLREHTEAQLKKLRGRDDAESQVERLYDMEAALLACFDGHPGARGLDDFCHDIAALFSDDRPGVMLSTIHKAKGLESERVFILRPDKLPLIWKGQKPWEQLQEMNLKYVAITRSLDTLVYVRQAGESIGK